MEVQLNEQTKVEVNAKLSIFRTTIKDQHDVLHVRNDRIYAADVSNRKGFSKVRFAIFFFAGVLGGYAHFMYDTQFLGFEPNPGIIFGIFFILVVIGFFVSFTKRRTLKFTVDSSEEGTSFEFPISKDLGEKELEDLMEILVS
jgi:hypothetical protein